MKPRVYQLFRPAEPAPRARGTIAVLLLVATLLTGLGIQRVRARHEVIRVGYALSKATEDVRHLREVRRQLELERATLTNPERIRALATALGMAPVPPDQIRVVPAGRRVPQMVGRIGSALTRPRVSRWIASRGEAEPR